MKAYCLNNISKVALNTLKAPNEIVENIEKYLKKKAPFLERKRVIGVILFQICSRRPKRF